MERYKEADLNELSVNFAGQYIDEKFKSGRDVEKALVLNCIAHGFFMGARHAEDTDNLNTMKTAWIRFKGLFTDDYLPLYPASDTKWIEKHADKAALYYIKKKRYERMSFGEKALIQSTVALGFKRGFQDRYAVPRAP